MRINRALNLVLEVETPASGTVYVHSTPISRQVFERHFLVISKTFAALLQQGLAMVGGPPVARLMLERVAKETTAPGGGSEWDAPDGVDRALLPEMRRLTNVIVSTGGGWETIPLSEAAQRKLLDEDDIAEVEGFIAFFTCNSAMMRPNDFEALMTGMQRLWGAQTTSSNCTEFAAGLPTSTATDSFGETAPTSSVPL